MHAAPLGPQQNYLLAALGRNSFRRVVSHLDLVSLALGEVLYLSCGPMSHAYFPVDCIIANLYVTETGASAESAVVGNDGMLGIGLLMGGKTTTRSAVVVSAGFAYRLPAKAMMCEFNIHDDFLELLLRYTHAVITQIEQTAVCNRHHSIDQQLCRWLLLALDRLPGNKLFMTQELIASMLGVRREGVTDAAGKLQRLGVISYCRGHIAVLDRPALERLCCECYSVVKNEADRLLPTRAPTPTIRKVSDRQYAPVASLPSTMASSITRLR